MNETDAIINVAAKEIAGVIKKKKVPEWVVIIGTNILILVGTIILEQNVAGKLPMQAWGVSIIGVVMGIVRMMNKTAQDKVIIETSVYNTPTVSTDVPTK